MIRHSKNAYTSYEKRPSPRDRIVARLEGIFARMGWIKDDSLENVVPGREAVLEATGSLTMGDLVGLAEQALRDFPDDPEAIHKLVDDFWANKQEISASSEGSYISNIRDETKENTDFRRVLFTDDNMQLVLMSLKPGEEIGKETHPETSQFIRIEEGNGTLLIYDEEFSMETESAVIVPEGVEHNLINTGGVDLKLYTLYSTPEHKEVTVHKTKDDSDLAMQLGTEAKP